MRIPLAGLLIAGAAAAAAALISLVASAGDRPSAQGISLHTVGRGTFARRVTAEGYLKAMRATPIAVPVRNLSVGFKVAWIAQDGTRVRVGDPVARFDATDMEKSFLDSRDDVTSASRKADRAGALAGADVESLAEEARIATLEREHAETYSRLDPQIFSRNEIIESTIDKDLAAEKADHAAWKTGATDRRAATEIQIHQIEREAAALRMRQAEEGLSLLRITAPHDGLLVLERDRHGEATRPGDNVWPGEKIAEIPDLSEMEAKVYVLEADAGGLEPGRPATVRLSARPDVIFPGIVVRVDALAKPLRQGLPVQYFETILALSPPSDLSLKPGQRLTAEILLEELRDVLAVPRQAVFEEDGRRFVYRLEGGDLRPVGVKVGRYGLAAVLVEEGLSEGDRIALRDPSLPASAIFEPGARVKGGKGSP